MLEGLLMRHKNIRIGIDVGGTFTHAIAIDNNTYNLIADIKIPTTHDAPEGVSKGIVDSLNLLVNKLNISGESVVFIAHSTTQATNALLEGDVEPVGIIGMAQGIDKYKAKTDTEIGKIELAMNKYITTHSEFIELRENNISGKLIDKAINNLKEKGARVIVASQAFGVDNNQNEQKVAQMAEKYKIPCTLGSDISQLYGLKIRTKTAAINASILPKMVEVAERTNYSVNKTGIKSPLMIMRGDGGVMNIKEMMKKPIYTMLSGPAAGVAGALMFEKVSDGIFLEVGGTSVDISAIKNGKVMLKYAEVGGHKTYVNSLDTRTIGVAGGSMVKVENKKIVDVGPRSAHIAGLGYSAFTEPDEIVHPELVLIRPTIDDTDHYAIIKSQNGKEFAITVTCAANALGYVKEGDYSYGNVKAAKKALKPLAVEVGMTVEETARTILKKAAEKVKDVVEKLMIEYKIDRDHITLVGGGGGSTALVPFTAEMMRLPYKIAYKAEVISAIGVALAMLRNVIEKTIINPTEEELNKISKEVELSLVRMGANPETINTYLEVDTTKNIVRATAVGTTELRTKNFNAKKIDEKELREKAAQSMKIDKKMVDLVANTDILFVYTGKVVQKRLFGLLNKTSNSLRIIDDEGVIRLQVKRSVVTTTTCGELINSLSQFIKKNTKYIDGLPRYLCFSSNVNTRNNTCDNIKHRYPHKKSEDTNGID
jgi:N-methylhydantoinase A